MGRITIRHVGGNTLSGTVEQVLATHLAPGWSLVTQQGVAADPLASSQGHYGPYGYGSQDR